MLHAKFLENQSTDFKDEYFLSVFIIHGRGGHLCHVTNIMLTNFHFYVPKSLHIKFG